MRARIRERLEAIGKDQYEVAEEAGLSRTSIWSFLTGRTDTIRRSNLEKIAKALECRVDDLMGEPDKPTATKGLGLASNIKQMRPAPGPSRKASQDVTLEIEGIVGAWSSSRSGTASRIPIAPDPRHPASQQTAFMVIGDEWKDIGISDGSIVTVAKISPRDGDLVAIRLTRENGEATIVLTEWVDGEAGSDHGEDGWDIETVGVVVRESRVF